MCCGFIGFIGLYVIDLERFSRRDKESFQEITLLWKLADQQTVLMVGCLTIEGR